MVSSHVADKTARAVAASTRSKPFWPMLGLVAALIGVPIIGGDFFAYQIALFLIYGIATQGVALCWGRLGFLPLGQALFFGLGAYLSGGALKLLAGRPALIVIGIVVALTLPSLLAWVVARLIFSRSSRSGSFFSLITLAMTMLGFLIVQQWSSVTGGFNGTGEIPEIPGLERYSTFYWLVAVVALLSTLSLVVLIRRPLGVLWTAVAQNEDRLQLFGYATDRIKAQAYAISALLAAIAGALFAVDQGIVTPETMGFALSTEFVIWAAIGGKASPYGALVGAVLVGFASAELRDLFAYWEVLVALAAIFVVRFFPGGLADLLTRRWHVATAWHPEPTNAPPVEALPQLSLKFVDVRVSQSAVKILDGLSFELHGPGIRAVIGPNGAGKTSAFNAMTGRLHVRAGRIHVGEHDVTAYTAWKVARLGVGRKLQIPSVFADLSVAQNLAIALWAGRLRGFAVLGHAPLGWHTALLDELLQYFPELREQGATLAGRLSQGQRQALELVMTLLPEPKMLLLDEPCAGLSPAETHHMIKVIRRAVERLGAAALLIEHDLAAVAALGGEVLVLHQGRLLAQGSLETLQSNPEVRKVYSGAHK
ncbi:branched-chain amino acid ABC transporter ATP-binding protein/permease [Paraburkholderia tropica]|uniref:branched-chain amino acid ABC transporter ATP-binding protein/permease n=1 Tax=Paraburkholderia tropica TaxID=92647 RepID=UPI002AB74F99|nr:ATP-binding cassette domain-containing protein [Paraburkholderia tropica]